MNFTDFMDKANLVELAMQNMQIFAFVLLAVVCFIILFVGLFKGFKAAVILTLIVAALGGAGILAYLIYALATDNLMKLAVLLINWLPTVLFFIPIVTATLIGAWRGFRKSIILLVQSLCAAVLLITVYFILISSPMVDEWILNLINFFMGGEGTFQSAIGADTGCTTLKETIASFITTRLQGDAALIVGDNIAYVMTLVDLIYRIVFAIVCYILYLLLVFILYIVYHIFYSERKYKKKKSQAFAADKTDCTYRPRRIGGGVVGFMRGTLVAIISISFLGSAFFMIAGGTGEKNRFPDYSFGDENSDNIYTVFRAVESYGSQGIFQVLNTVKDPDDTPYYLFAADIVLSGGLDDGEDINENILFRKEIGAYTGFAYDTINLLVKYGGDDIAEILNSGGQGEGEQADVMAKVMEIMSLPQFQLEFNNLIDNFDSQTYFINFSLSLVNSIISHIDDMNFASVMDENSKELIKVMFKRGYLSDAIPDERELKDKLGTDVITSGSIPPSISVNQLLTKQDVQTVLKMVLSVMGSMPDDQNNVQQTDILEIVKPFISELENLSIFGTNRKDEMNPVLARLYCFMENAYLTEEGEDGIRYEEVATENVYWGGELKTLISVVGDIVTLYGNVIGNSENVQIEDFQMVEMLLSVFDKNNAGYAENIALYDSISDKICNSVLLGKVFASGKIMTMLRTQLATVSPSLYLPPKISFENKYDGDGNLVLRGEAYQFFYGLRLLGENKQLMDMLIGGSADADLTDMLKALADTLTDVDDYGNTLSTYLTQSVLLRSVISATIIDAGNGVLAVPTVSLDVDEDGEPVNLINAGELKQIFDSMAKIVELIIPITEGEFKQEDLEALLNDKTLSELLDSGNGIIEGTVANILVEQLKNNSTVIVPAKLYDYEEWVSANSGELTKLRAALKTLGSHFWDIMDGETDGLFDVLNGFDEGEIHTLIASQVLHYTLSNFMQGASSGVGGLKIIIPSSAKIRLRNDTIESLITEDEITAFLMQIRNLGIASDMSAGQIMSQIIINRDSIANSKMITASIVNLIVNDKAVSGALEIPEELRAEGTPEKLEEFSDDNIWNDELVNFLASLDEMFGVSEGGQFDTSEDGLGNCISRLLKSINSPAACDESVTKLEVCYRSVIFKNTLRIEMDYALAGLLDQKVIDGVKDTDGYYYMQEISELAYALEELQLDNIDLLEAYDFDNLGSFNEPSKNHPEQTRLEALYSSDIMGGIITYSVCNVDGLVIPYEAMSAQNFNIISVEEIQLLIDAITAIKNDANLGGWNADGDMVLPDDSNSAREKVADSLIIRATMTEKILELNDNFTVRAENIQLTTDEKGNDIAILCREQMLAFFNILDVCGKDDGALSVPDQFTDIASIRQYSSSLDVLCSFDATYFIISDVIKQDLSKLPFTIPIITENIEVCSLSKTDALTVQYKTLNVVLYSEIVRVLEMFDY